MDVNAIECNNNNNATRCDQPAKWKKRERGPGENGEFKSKIWIKWTFRFVCVYKCAVCLCVCIVFGCNDGYSSQISVCVVFFRSALLYIEFIFAVFGSVGHRKKKTRTATNTNTIRNGLITIETENRTHQTHTGQEPSALYSAYLTFDMPFAYANRTRKAKQKTNTLTQFQWRRLFRNHPDHMPCAPNYKSSQTINWIAESDVRAKAFIAFAFAFRRHTLKFINISNACLKSGQRS